MNFSKKLVLCVAFLCVASFAQQDTTPKSSSPTSQGSVSTQNLDSQKTPKATTGVIKQTSTWTKIKDMFK